MNEQTIRVLNQLNRKFYDDQAKSWQASRQYYWPSWEKFTSFSSLEFTSQLKVADVGCGTGRFAKFICGKYPLAEYHGFDLSPSLLELAQKSVTTRSQTNDANPIDPRRIKFISLDIVEALLNNKALLSEKYDLIVVFGVLHHLPSKILRRRFLTQLAEHLLPKGEIWLTTWQPAKLDQKTPKQLQKSEILATLGLKNDDLELGDSFVGWKDTKAIRYVHWLDKSEEQELKKLPHLKLAQGWLETSAGERGNQCWLFSRTS